jgi:inosine triphosphate pyrophosphatase
MISFTLVTGNKQKLQEYIRLLPSTVSFDTVSIDLEEIQSLNSKVIVEHKVRQAYEHVGRPVIVEDVSAGLDALKGLPGPFIKFFEQQLGKDALYQLVRGNSNTKATVTCTIGYYDGTRLIFVVPACGDEGFGFDFCFKPKGHNKTFAEMERSEKDSISHRSLALEDLLAQLATK